MGTSGGATGSSTSGSTSGSATVSFVNDVMPIFQMSCATGGLTCHGDPNVTTQKELMRPYLGPPTGSASTTLILAGLVGKASAEDPTMPLVTAGDSTKSFLQYKMDGTQNTLAADCTTGDYGSCGLLMPETNAEPLPQATLDTVRAWINQGALNN